MRLPIISTGNFSTCNPASTVPIGTVTGWVDVTLDMARQRDSITNPFHTGSIKCDYCRCRNNASVGRCEYCGAPLP